MLGQIFISFVCISAVGTLLAAVLSLVRPVTRRFFSASWHYYVLLAVTLLMLLPVRISLPESTDAKMYTGTQNAATAEQELQLLTKPVNPVVLKQENGIFTEAAQALSEYTGILSAAWITVAAAIFGHYLLSYAAMLKKLKRDSAVVCCPELSAYTQHKVTVMRAEGVSSPFTTGILLPIIVLPKSKLSAESLHHILAHEATHINRHDMLFKWLTLATKSLHWFNPALLLICRRLEEECEISCDFSVVKNMDAVSKAGYMNTIMELVSAGKAKNNRLSTALSGKAKKLKRRFLMIKDKTNTNKTAAVISGIVAVSLLCTGVFAGGILSDRYTKNAELQDEGTPEAVKTEASANPADNLTSDAAVKDDNQAAADISEAVDNNAAESKESKPVYLWPCGSTEVSAPFNPEKGHYAADIRAEKGSDVYASINATVADTGFNAKDGNYIKLAAGSTEIFLAHLLEASVEIGDTVKTGDVIGKVGSTGMATGPHLHYSLSVDGEYVDPVTVESVELIIAE